MRRNREPRGRTRASDTGETRLRGEVEALRAEIHGETRRREGMPADGRGQGVGIEAYLDTALVGSLFGRYLARKGLRELRRGLPQYLGVPRAVSEKLAAQHEEIEWRLDALLPGDLTVEDLFLLAAPFHDSTDRKHWGKFYTPRFVVDHILDHTLQPKLDADGPEAIRLLEPSCGAGDFVLPAYDRFARSYSGAGLGRLEAHRAILRRNLFALDTDPTGVALTSMGLALRCEEALREDGLPQVNVRCANALLASLGPANAPHAEPRSGGGRPAPEQMPLAIDREAAGAETGGRTGSRKKRKEPAPPPELPAGALSPIEGIETGSFDVVVGNPPFGAKLTGELTSFFRGRYSVARGKVETAALFLERSLDLARPEGGAVGLVMPHSFSRSGAYRKARELLLARTVVTTLADLGKAFEGVMFNTMAFTAVRGGKRGTVALCRRDGEGRIRRSSEVPQDFFLGRDTLPLHVPAGLVDTLQAIEMRAEPLRRLAKIERGENIKGRAGILGRGTGAGLVPVVRGTDIKPYGILEPGRIPSIPAKLGFRPPSRFPEIVIQNISSVIEATLMPPGMLPLDTVNILWMKNDLVQKEYLIGLLNSRFLDFYFRNLLINRATLTIHLDDPMLGGLPIVVASASERRKVVKAVTDLFAAERHLLRGGPACPGADGERERLEARIRKLRLRVDDLVDRIYGITEALSREIRSAGVEEAQARRTEEGGS